MRTEVEGDEGMSAPSTLTLKRALDANTPFDVRALANAHPEIAALEQTKQDPGWHAEGDVLRHTELALEVLWQGLDGSDPAWARRSAATLLHDIGKPPTTFLHPEKQRLVSYGHAEVGVSLARELLRGAGWTGAQRDPVLAVVSKHMHPGQMMSRNGASERAFVKLALEAPLEDLLAVLEADRLGREADDVQSRWLETQAEFHPRLEALGLRNQPFFELTDAELEQIGIEPEKRGWVRGSAAYKAWRGSMHAHEAAVSHAYDLRGKSPRGTLYLLSGIQGSGKSTWATKSGHTVISSDAIRLEHKLDPHDKGANQRVFQIAGTRLKDQLRAGATVIFDATNLDVKRRSSAVDLARDYGYEIVGVAFDIEPEVAIARNAKRAEPVPESVVRTYMKQLMPFAAHEADRVLRPYEEVAAGLNRER